MTLALIGAKNELIEIFSIPLTHLSFVDQSRHKHKKLKEKKVFNSC